MVDGPGKYDRECVALMKATMGSIVAVLVIDGVRGSGYETQMQHMRGEPIEHLAEKMRSISVMMRQMADQYEVDATRLVNGELKPDKLR